MLLISGCTGVDTASPTNLERASADAGLVDGGRSGGGAVDTGGPFGETHAGSYHVGPVDWEESVFTNSCGPYPLSIQTLEGINLAGVDNAVNANGTACDACAQITTRMGKALLVRIVTTGVSNGAGDMDLSPEAFATIHLADPQGTASNPRPMTWRFAHCASASAIRLQFQTEANAYWTSLWVRNSNLSLSSVKVKSSKHASFTVLRRETDGTLNDDNGFGEGPFTLQLTAVDGQIIEQTFTGFTPGALVETSLQFH